MAVRTIREFPTEFPSARLYLDDIEEISNILLEAVKLDDEDDHSGDNSITLPQISYQIKNKEMDSISDLKERGGTVSDLTITAESKKGLFPKRITIGLYGHSRPSIHFYYLSEHSDAWAVYSKIRTVFDAKRFVIKNAIADLPSWVGTAGFIAALLVPLLFSVQKGWKIYVISLLCYYIIGGLLLIWFYRPNRVVLSYAHEHAKLSTQVRRGFIRDIAMLVLGAGITKTIELIFSRLTK